MPRAKKLTENSTAASENSTDAAEIADDNSTFVKGSAEAKDKTARVLAMQKGGKRGPILQKKTKKVELYLKKKSLYESSSDSDGWTSADEENCEFAGDGDDPTCYFHYSYCPRLFRKTSNSPSETTKSLSIQAVLLPKKTEK